MRCQACGRLKPYVVIRKWFRHRLFLLGERCHRLRTEGSKKVLVYSSPDTCSFPFRWHLVLLASCTLAMWSGVPSVHSRCKHLLDQCTSQYLCNEDRRSVRCPTLYILLSSILACRNSRRGIRTAKEDLGKAHTE